jgi:hypothetical protein
MLIAMSFRFSQLQEMISEKQKKLRIYIFWIIKYLIYFI